MICNNKYIKFRDEKGYINYFGNSIAFKKEEIKKSVIEGKNLMHNSIHIPPELVIRSLPINVELLELLKIN